MMLVLFYEIFTVFFLRQHKVNCMYNTMKYNEIYNRGVTRIQLIRWLFELRDGASRGTFVSRSFSEKFQFPPKIWLILKYSRHFLYLTGNMDYSSKLMEWQKNIHLFFQTGFKVQSNKIKTQKIIFSPWNVCISGTKLAEIYNVYYTCRSRKLQE